MVNLEASAPARTESAALATPAAPRAPRDLGQVLRYLVVGGWNTAFGYGVFAGLTYLFTDHIPYPYMAANALGSVIAITVAFFGYKLFVFKTEGNYLREYLRVYVVYGASSLLSLALLPLFVALVHLAVANEGAVPYIAQAFTTPLVVLISFVGHQRFSFKP